uniref:Uncharacterized protein n=1 Tax=Anguilla anguilla TaxID=7936 RepID=A0A0E9XGI7_ANGAN
MEVCFIIHLQSAVQVQPSENSTGAPVWPSYSLIPFPSAQNKLWHHRNMDFDMQPTSFQFAPTSSFT